MGNKPEFFLPIMVCSKVPFYVVVEGEAEEINFLMLKLGQQPLVFFVFFLLPTETDEKYRQIFQVIRGQKMKICQHRKYGYSKYKVNCN